MPDKLDLEQFSAATIFHDLVLDEPFDSLPAHDYSPDGIHSAEMRGFHDDYLRDVGQAASSAMAGCGTADPPESGCAGEARSAALPKQCNERPSCDLKFGKPGNSASDLRPVASSLGDSALDEILVAAQCCTEELKTGQDPNFSGGVPSQIDSVDLDSQEDCQNKFQSNFDYGLLILLGFILGKL